MKQFFNTIHRWENKFDKIAEKFAVHHPCLSMIAVFFGTPLLILSGVAGLTIFFAFPISFLFGWL